MNKDFRCGKVSCGGVGQCKQEDHTELFQCAGISLETQTAKRPSRSIIFAALELLQNCSLFEKGTGSISHATLSRQV